MRIKTSIRAVTGYLLRLPVSLAPVLRMPS